MSSLESLIWRFVCTNIKWILEIGIEIYSPHHPTFCFLILIDSVFFSFPLSCIYIAMPGSGDKVMLWFFFSLLLKNFHEKNLWYGCLTSLSWLHSLWFTCHFRLLKLTRATPASSGYVEIINDVNLGRLVN